MKKHHFPTISNQTFQNLAIGIVSLQILILNTSEEVWMNTGLLEFDHNIVEADPGAATSIS